MCLALLLTEYSPIYRGCLLGLCSGLVSDTSLMCCQVSINLSLCGRIQGLWTDWSLVTYSTNPILNVFFSLFFITTTYFYIISMVEDPGYVPKLGSRNQQRSVIAELFESWKFDEENFCVFCMIRKPLRSKHCRRCGRCVAKHDQ